MKQDTTTIRHKLTIVVVAMFLSEDSVKRVRSENNRKDIGVDQLLV